MKEETSSSPPSFPTEIWEDIFCRLPSKSLVRLKSACKEWNSMVSNPYFLRAHYTHHHRLVGDQLMISTTCYDSCNSIFSLYNAKYGNVLEPVSATSTEFSDRFSLVTDPKKTDCGGPYSGGEPTLLGSYNGLIALRSKFCSNGFFLWNPLTKERISAHPNQEEFSGHGVRYKCLRLAGLCYNTYNDEYTVVVANVKEAKSLDGDYSLEMKKVSLVNFNTGKSKNLEGNIEAFGCRLQYLQQDVGIVVCGVPHWLMRYSSADCIAGKNGILYFDLVLGMFKQMAKPETKDGVEEKILLGLGALEGQRQLGIIFCQQSNLEVWVMKEYGKSESWTYMFNISDFIAFRTDLFLVGLLGILSTGEILLKESGFDDFFGPIGCRKRLENFWAYNPISDILRPMDSPDKISRFPYYNIFNIISYEPSLVSPRQLQKYKRQPKVKVMKNKELIEYFFGDKHCLDNSPPELEIPEMTPIDDPIKNGFLPPWFDTKGEMFTNKLDEHFPSLMVH